jgi:hypothetical protein
MPSSFTTNKTLELPANGAYIDTWNVPVNGDMSIIDQALGGTTNLNATSGSATLTVTQYRSLILSISGAIAADVTYTIPSGVGGQWVCVNNTSGNYSVYLASGGGGNVEAMPQGQQTLMACDGTDVWVVSSAATAVPTGGGTNKIFYNNDVTVTVDYSIPPSQNSGTFGPITIDDGVTVTIPDTSTWTVI